LCAAVVVASASSSDCNTCAITDPLIEGVVDTFVNVFTTHESQTNVHHSLSDLAAPTLGIADTIV
jgi:hypothetical protein